MQTIWKTTAKAGLIFILISTVTAECHNTCKCANYTVHCPGPKILPALPDGTKDVFLENIQLSVCKEKNFADPSWQTINKLDIILQNSSENVTVQDGFFAGLKQLQFLGLHGINSHEYLSQTSAQIVKFVRGSFQGLDNLKHLDLSGNPSLNVNEIINALQDKDIMPVLEILDISELQSLQKEPINITLLIRNCIAPRHLKEIYMNSLNINELYFRGMEDLCKTLEIFSLKNTKLQFAFSAEHFKCESIKVLDFTGLTLQYLQSVMKYSIEPFYGLDTLFNNIYGMMFTVETLILDNILPSEPRPISFTNNYTYECENFNFRLKYLSFRQNYLERLNVSFQNLSFQQDSEIDLSSNNIDYIHPKCVDPGNNISKINLAKNRLHIMQINYFDDFRIFLHNYINVEDVDLSFNQLDIIPFDMFLTNSKLRKLNLGSNVLKTIDFNPVEFMKLSLLDMRNNSLLNLDYSRRQSIQLLGTSKSVAEVAVYLGQNLYTCSCDSNSFETWVKHSSFLKGDSYICSFNGAAFDMKGSGIDQIQHVCKQQRIQRTFIILACFFVFFIVVSCVFVYLLRRHRLQKDNVNKILNQLRQSDANECFLVFLCYCSEDAELVNSHIYDQLNDEISKLVGKKGTYVCIDEKHFRPGFPVLTEIISNLQKSYVMICLTSQTFCDKIWCQMEVEEAYNLHKPIILLVKDYVEQETLPKILSRLFQRNIIAKVTTEENGSFQFSPPLEVLCSSVIDLAVKFSVESRKFHLH